MLELHRAHLASVLFAFIAGCGGGGRGGDTTAAIPAPVIAKQPQPITVAAGSAASFDIQLVGSAADYSFRWRRNGIPIDGGTTKEHTTPPTECADAASVFSVAITGGGVTAVSEPAPLWVTGCDISLLAGTIGGHGNVDGTRTTARFNGPAAVAADAVGNLYVADTGNQTIRKVTAGGQVVTLAGLAGQPGSNDGVGTLARFDQPRSLAVDSTGNVYVRQGGAIRRIDPSGRVSIFAGSVDEPGYRDGVGIEARFNAAGGIAVDSQDTLYVTEYETHVIRRIGGAGAVTTVAGTPGQRGSRDGVATTALFDNPYAVAAGPDGSVLVGDKGSSTVRRIAPTGEVITVAGAPYARGSLDGVGAEARFLDIEGIAIDQNSGDAYLSDYTDKTVRKLTPGGAVKTIAGRSITLGDVGTEPVRLLRFPGAPAVDAQGNVYVPDAADSVIRKISPLGTVSVHASSLLVRDAADGVGAAARFDLPAGLATDALGNLWVAELGNAVVRKVSPSGVVSTVAGAFRQRGSEDGVGAAARFTSPRSLAIDALGTLYVAEDDGGAIRRVTPDGGVTTLHGLTGHSVAVDAQGNLFAGSLTESVVRMRRPTGEIVILTGAGTPGIPQVSGAFTPAAMDVDAIGNLYVADPTNFVILRISPDGHATTVAGLAGDPGTADGIGAGARFASPSALKVGPDGNVYVYDSSIRRTDSQGRVYQSIVSNTIRKVTPSGVVTTVVGVPGLIGDQPGPLPGSLSGPLDLAFDARGMLFVASEGGVLKVQIRAVR